MPANLIVLPQNDEEAQDLNKNIYWKIRAGCCRIIAKFFQQQMYSETQKKQNYPVAQYIQPLLQKCLQFLINSKTQYISRKVMFYSMKIIIYSIKITTAFEILLQYMNQIIFEIILPLLCFTKKDEQLWMQDPQEFIRREDDFTLYVENTKMIAMDLLIQICQNPKNGQEILLKFVNFVMENLAKEDLTWKARDTFLWVVGELQSKIQKLPEITDDWLEIQIAKFVTPQLNSPNCFLRGRACWVIGRYGGILHFSNKENLKQIIQGICKCIMDESLPVKLKAAITLSCLLEYKETIEMLQPELNRILEIYLKLMNEIECEEVFSSLEGIVQRFSNDIVPFAFELIQHLGNMFLKLVKNQGQKPNDSESDIDDGENELSAVGCLTTIHRILSSPLPKDLYPKIFENLIPVFNYIFSVQGIDFSEDAFPIMNLILYYGEQLTPMIIAYYPILLYLMIEMPPVTADLKQLGIQEQILPLYESICNQVHPLASDQLTSMQSLLQNYIYLLKENLFILKEPLFQKTFYELLEEVLTKIIQSGFKGCYETDMIYALKLLISIIENNANSNIQPIVEKIVINCLGYLNKGRKTPFEVAIYEVISIALWFNPLPVLTYLTQTNCLQQFFLKWNQLSKHFKDLYTKTYVMYGLASIFRVSPTQMPEGVHVVLQDVLKWLVKLSNEIVEQREDDEFQDLSDDEDSVKFLNLYFECQEEDLLDKIKLDNVININPNEVKNKINAENEDDDDEDDEDFNESTYHPYKFHSLLLDNDELKYLEDIFQGLMKNEQTFYANISNSLTEKEKAQLLLNFQKSHEQFKKKQDEKEQEKQKRKTIN